MSTEYDQGNYYERKTAELLRGDGYETWQARGSKGCADLIALKPREIVLVQVKSGTKSISHKTFNDLYSLGNRLGAQPIVAEWKDEPRTNGRVLHWRRITGPHLPNSRDWPTRAWNPDWGIGWEDPTPATADQAAADAAETVRLERDARGPWPSDVPVVEHPPPDAFRRGAGYRGP